MPCVSCLHQWLKNERQRPVMPNNRRYIPFNKPFIVGKELFYIAKAVMDGSISGDGQFTNLCQRWLESHLRCSKALLTHSCTAALEMAAILIDLKPGDEVIMPSYTFVSTANAFVLRGGVPVFVDIRPDTLNIDERQVAAAITERTRAVVAVHYAGQACAMNELLDLCRAKGLYLVEDAAQAILSFDEGQALGAIGDFGCLSFHETKNVICGEGGALLINNEQFIERAEIIWQKGTNRKAFYRGEVDKYTWVDIGSSYLPSDITAAFLYAQLEHAKRINTHRRSLHERYVRLLAGLATDGKISLAGEVGEKAKNAHIFYILCRSEGERHGLIRHLASRGVNAVFHYSPLHSSPAGLSYGRAFGDMAVTDQMADCLLRLPMYSEMTTDTVSYICEMIHDFYGKA